MEDKNMLDTYMPLVSIIIPVYNGSNYMREAIDSALAQTYPNIEVIVVNDGSKDNGETERLAKSYGDRIRYFHKENGGVSTALNYGIQQMNGEYFSWLSHDDVYEPDKILNQVRYADQNTVVMCGRYLINKNSEIIGDIRDKYRFQKKCSLTGMEAAIALLKQGCFNGCTLLIPKKAFSSVGLFDEKLRYGQDLLMWLRIFLSGCSLEFVEKKDVRSRVHEGQLTNTGRELYHNDCRAIASKMIQEICAKSSREENVLYYFAKYNAVYHTPSVVKDCISEGKKNGLFDVITIINLRRFQIYGAIRPMFRKIYYKIFKKVSTH